MQAGKAAGCRLAERTVKARLEICGDAGIVLRQEISHREIDGAYQKSDACQNAEEPALQYLRNIACDISWRREKAGMPVNVKLENIVATPLLFCEKEIIWKKEI